MNLSDAVKGGLQRMMARNLDFAPDPGDLPFVHSVMVEDLKRHGLVDDDGARVFEAFERHGGKSERFPKAFNILQNLPRRPEQKKLEAPSNDDVAKANLAKLQKLIDENPALKSYGERRRVTLQAFQKFHKENPEVYEELKKLALGLKRKGITRYSLRGLWEVLRWRMHIKTKSQYKLNNNFTALYARILLDNNPELSGMFETRER